MDKEGAVLIKWMGWQICILLLLFPSVLLAQTGLLDSLKKLFINPADEIASIEAGEDISKYYAEVNRDSALYYIDQHLLRVRKKRNQIKEADALALKGYILMKYGLYAESLHFLLDALKIAENPASEQRKSGAPDQPKQRVLRMESLANIHHYWGSLMRNAEDYEQAKLHYLIAIRIAEKEQLEKLIVLINLSLGKLYIKLNKLDSALQFEKAAERHAEKSGYLRYEGHMYKYMADIYFAKGNKPLARQYYYKTILAAKGQANYSALSLAYNGLADYYCAERNKDSSLYYAIAAKKEFEGLGAQVSQHWNLGQVYTNLYLAYELSGQKDSVLKYLKLTLEAKDSLNVFRSKSLFDLQHLSIQEQSRLNELEAEKGAFRNRILMISLFSGVCVFLLAAAILYRNNQQKLKSNRVLRKALKKLKNAQNKLIAQKEKAESSEQFKQRFLAHMSHEIRTPLHGIAGFTDLLLDTSLNEKQRRWLSSIHQSTDRLGEVVNDILELSKLEAGELKLRKVPFSPANVAKDVQESLSLKAESKGIELRLNLQENVPAAVLGDPTRLYQILMNLVGNAVKFTEKGSVSILIDVDSMTDEEPTVELRFRVVDTGIGIPAEKITAVFGSYQQAGEDTVARFGGTGLGLTVTRDLVQLHGSKIQVESELAKGTTFSFVFSYPLADAIDLATVSSLGKELFFSQVLHVLLVDDNELNREIAYEAITRHFENANIVEAVNGKDAIETLQNQYFDLVLMDMQMPEMSGTEATRQIRKLEDIEKRDLPIIALTASATPEEIEKALESGMNMHLGKPFKPHQLALVMAESLGLQISDASIPEPKPESLVTQPHSMDLSFLRDFTDGDEEQMQYFIQKFLQQYPLEIQKIEKALNEEDRDSLYHIAHSFKPQLEFVGLKEAGALAFQLEQKVHTGASIGELAAIFTQLRAILGELSHTL